MTNTQPDEFVLVGESQQIQGVRRQIQAAAASDAAVLFTGESGTGKEIAAHLLHTMSDRRDRNFVRINAPAIPTQLFESEMFGHTPGALTERCGKLDQANGGTLFLDEVGELEPPVQAKLLQVLQDFRFFPLGSSQEHFVDVRLAAATNHNLIQAVAEGSFRADLFYRLHEIQIQMPALRERQEDVPLLMAHYLEYYAKKLGKPSKPLSPIWMEMLVEYHWPGNVRELRNLAERCVLLGEDCIASMVRESRLANPLFPRVDLNTPLRIQTKRAMRDLEGRIIMGVLEANKWNRKKAAKALDISYRSLLYKIKEAGVPSLRRRASTSGTENHA